MSTQSRPSLLLIGSLAVNFTLIGLMVGLLLARTGPASDPTPETDAPRAGIERSDRTPGAYRRWSPEDRATLRSVERTFRDTRGAPTELREAHEAARRELYDILIAPDYDRAAAEDAFVKFRDTENAVRAAMQDRFSQAMEELSQDQRQLIAERLTRTRTSQPRRRRFRRDGQRPN